MPGIPRRALLLSAVMLLAAAACQDATAHQSAAGAGRDTPAPAGQPASWPDRGGVEQGRPAATGPHAVRHPLPLAGTGPGARDDELPPALILPQAPVPQGGSFFVVVEGAGINAVNVAFAGRTYRAARDGGGWLAVIGVGQQVGLTEQHLPGLYPVQAAVALDDGQTLLLDGTVTVTPTDFPVEAITLDPSTSALLDPALTEQELAVLRPLLAQFTPQRLWNGFFVRPANGPITDVFGSRRSFNGGPATGSHSGVDFGAEAGTPVVAAASGRVVFAGPLPVRGNAVYIDHGLGVFTGYDHLSHITVQPGQEVRAGEPIGAVGATGLVTGPHLHWEVAVGGYFVDGLLWLPPDGRLR